MAAFLEKKEKRKKKKKRSEKCDVKKCEKDDFVFFLSVYIYTRYLRLDRVVVTAPFTPTTMKIGMQHRRRIRRGTLLGSPKFRVKITKACSTTAALN